MKKEITFLIPSMNGGGAEKVTLLIANELVERGWNVTLMLSRLEGPYLKRLSTHIRIIQLKNRSISKNIIQIAAYLRQEKPVIFYSSMMYVNVIAGAASIIARYRGKLIFSEHSHASEVKRTKKTLSTKIIFQLARFTYRKASTIVCVSQGVADDIKRLFKGINSPVVINNPVETYNPVVRDDDLTKFRILSIGRLDNDKNFQMLIRAFSTMLENIQNKDRYELCILGEGCARFELESLIDELNLKKCVFLPGFVDDTAHYLRKADLFVFTSNREGFGNVLVEALSAGLPVISTDCPSGPSEILQYGKMGKLIGINDINALVEAIWDEINHPTKQSKKSLRQKRAEDFSISKISDKYEALFIGLLEGR